jgi:nicotinate-nucleotide--dimethylbenzimidazole phosphoribosyltransferase
MTISTRQTTNLQDELELLRPWLNKIGPLDTQAMAAAQARQDQLTKPRGALGRLEELAVQLAAISGRALPSVTHKVVIVLAGDHGVVAEGISAYPQTVTGQMVLNFLAGGAAINVLARQAGARVVVADLGVAAPLPAWAGLFDGRVAAGTANLAQGPAMSRAQALQALRTGAELVEQELPLGLDILGAGEMGIGNTTPAAAIAAVLTGQDPAALVGRGAGLDDAGLAHKIAVVRQALAVNRPDPADGLDVLSKVGGFEIGGLAGAMLAAAAHRRPVMVDGFIASAAAMLAVALAPGVRPYLIAAHRSAEPGHDAMLAWLGLHPLLDLGMRLGEGTGAVLGMLLAEAACRTLAEMATFGEAGVDNKD